MLDFESDQVRGHEVRLFPTVRIGTDREAELRATAALCSMVRAVSEFGRAIVKAAGGPAGKITCYTEISIPGEVPTEPTFRPDAVIRVVRGQTEWRALLEVKVGDNPLEQEQFDNYHRIAKAAGFNAVITISNQSADSDGHPPLLIDGRRLRSCEVTHLSWDSLLSKAQVLANTQGVEDADQHWMLSEWIRYVGDPCSRIVAPATLGDHWNEVLSAAREGNLGAAVRFLPETFENWESFLNKVALRLRAQLGVDVERKMARADKKDVAGFVKRGLEDLAKTGTLCGALRVPDAAGDITVAVNLASRAVRYGLDVSPPTDGRAQTRVNWLLRQLKDQETPKDCVIRVDWDQGRVCSQARLSDAQADVSCLLRDAHQKPVPADAQPKRFCIEWTTTLAKGKARSTAPVLEGIAADLEFFYRHVVEGLVPYTPKAPRLPDVRGERSDDVVSNVVSVVPTNIVAPDTSHLGGRVVVSGAGETEAPLEIVDAIKDRPAALTSADQRSVDLSTIEIKLAEDL